MKFSQFFQYFAYLRRHLFGANSAKFRTFVLMKIDHPIEAINHLIRYKF